MISKQRIQHATVSYCTVLCRRWSQFRKIQLRAHVVENWNDLNHEDVGIIERMQAGRRSGGFDGGVLSPYWDPVQQHFCAAAKRLDYCALHYRKLIHIKMDRIQRSTLDALIRCVSKHAETVPF